MSAWTLEEAKNMLVMWIEAERAVSTGQEYTIGTRRLRRVDLSEIAKRIDFWRNQVAQLESGRSGGCRVFRAVPRDL